MTTRRVGRSRSRWTAHDPRATNLRMLDLETATNVDEALARREPRRRPGAELRGRRCRRAHRLVADGPGAGARELRLDGAASWRSPAAGWTGWRAPQEYPRIVDPPSGRLWTANARTIDAETWLAFIGDGGYDLGARAAQIRDDLLALHDCDRRGHARRSSSTIARCSSRAGATCCSICSTSSALADHPLRAQARELDRALVRRARQSTTRAIASCARCALADSQGRFRVAHRAARASDSRRRSSRRRRSSKGRCGSSSRSGRCTCSIRTTTRGRRRCSARSIARSTSLQKECKAAATLHLGRGATPLQMRHPLSRCAAVRRSLARHAGAAAARRRTHAASAGHGIRRVASAWWCRPGTKRRVPADAGRSVDHPLSPFYGAGHEAWVRGEPTPLLPGAAKHTLTLRPAATRLDCSRRSASADSSRFWIRCPHAFTGTDSYVATDDLMLAVNAAVTLTARCWSRASPAPARRMLAEEVAARARHAAATSGTSSRPPRRSRACTNTTPCRACATRSSATRRVHDIAQLHRQGRAVGGVRQRRAGRCC